MSCASWTNWVLETVAVPRPKTGWKRQLLHAEPMFAGLRTMGWMIWNWRSLHAAASARKNRLAFAPNVVTRRKIPTFFAPTVVLPSKFSENRAQYALDEAKFRLNS